MSQRSERLGERLRDIGADLNRVEDFYHVPVLAVLLAFMLWNRVQNWERFTAGGQVLFNGNDAWYHLRQVSYTVRNWPFTMPFDPWTGFPVGHTSGQFGTLYDQLVATAALVIGLGSPSDHTVALTLLFAPAVLGALTALPVYIIGKRLGGRPGGLFAVFVLALTPGAFLRRSLVGFSDHHVAEVFFLSVAVAAIMIAVAAGERDRPLYELVVEREWDALRAPTFWGAVAGLAIALYIWTWPPGVLLLAVLGAFLAVKLATDYLRGLSPDHVAYVGIVATVVTTVLTLLTIDAFDIQTTTISLLQPGLALAVGLGAAFMAWFARVWDARSLPRPYYPVAVAAVGLLLAGVFAVAVPDVFDYVVRQALRVVGYDATAKSRTVGEAQPVPLDQAASFFYRSYGLAFFLAVAAVLYSIWSLATEESNGELLFVVVLGVFMTAAALTQQRFDYYLAVPVAALSGWFLARIVALIELDAVDDIRDVEGYQVLAIAAVLLLVLGPFISFSAGANTASVGGATLTPVAAGGQTGPGEVTQWDSTLEWMLNETPAEGQYHNPDGERMAYYGKYDKTRDFSYGEGTYGVMSWWDYGHFITVLGDRIPFANPFQQHAVRSAVYLLEPDERAANKMLVSESGEETRYVMVDWKLDYPLSGKFFAPTAFYNSSGFETNASETVDAQPDLYRYVYDRQTGRPAFVLNQQRHYESMRTRLYKFHGSRIDPSANRVVPVVDYETVTGQNNREVAVTPSNRSQTVRQFSSMQQARQFVEQDGSAQIGGFGRYAPEPVPALQHYRLVQASQESAFQSRRFNQIMIRNMQGMALCRGGQQCLQVASQVQPTPPTWVKTFERVPGTTVEGEGPANATVTASVEMRMPASNQTFTYTQQAQTDQQGNFEMTLPYSTTGYDQFGPENGHTNVSVRATGPYTISTPFTLENDTIVRHQATANVTEAQVVGAEEGPVQVTLEEQRSTPGGENGSENETNASSLAPRTPPTTDGGQGTTAQSLSGPADWRLQARPSA